MVCPMYVKASHYKLDDGKEGIAVALYADVGYAQKKVSKDLEVISELCDISVARIRRLKDKEKIAVGNWNIPDKL